MYSIYQNCYFSHEVILSHKCPNQFPGKMFDILNSLEMIYDDNY